jgi:predicted transposase YbfD/YdcC
VRAHWTIENQLHWLLEVVFHDDLSRLGTNRGPRNMAVVCHQAVNILRAAWSTDYPHDVINGHT